MPACTVRELAAWLSFVGGQVAAGFHHHGLDRAVESVVRVRLVSLQDFQDISPQSAIMLPPNAFTHQTDVTPDEFVKMIADTQAVIIDTGLISYDEKTSKELCAASDLYGIPIISIRSDRNAIIIASQINEFIHEKQVKTARIAREAQKALGSSHPQSDPLRQWGTSLANHTGLVFILEDEYRAQILQVFPANTTYTEEIVHEALSSYSAKATIKPATPAGFGADFPAQRNLPHHMARAVAPLRIGAGIIGYMSLLGADEQITPDLIDILLQTAPSFAFELGKMRQKKLTSQNSAIEDLAALFSGALPDSELARRAQSHGCDLTLPQRVICAAPANSASFSAQWRRDKLEQFTKAWATADETGLYALINAEQQLEPIIAALRAVFNDELTFSFGAGSAVIGARNIKNTYNEARLAAQTALALGVKQRVLNYNELGVLEFLFPLLADGKLAEFSRAVLAPLISSDSGQDMALAATLDAWLTSHGNGAEAAERLAVHRNTLKYRLTKIEELLGKSLNNPDVRLTLQLALKIWRVRQN